MGTVMFYQLLHSAPEDVLALNAPRAMARGWRVMVRGTDPAGLERLEAALWLKGGEDGFLPHGLAGGPHDADQPVLLGLGAPENGARVLALVDGAAAGETELAAMERVWVLFDGSDPDRLQAARAQWKATVAAGHAAQYWSEAGGRWEKKAETAPPAA